MSYVHNSRCGCDECHPPVREQYKCGVCGCACEEQIFAPLALCAGCSDKVYEALSNRLRRPLPIGDDMDPGVSTR